MRRQYQSSNPPLPRLRPRFLLCVCGFVYRRVCANRIKTFILVTKSYVSLSSSVSTLRAAPPTPPCVHLCIVPIPRMVLRSEDRWWRKGLFFSNIQLWPKSTLWRILANIPQREWGHPVWLLPQSGRTPEMTCNSVSSSEQWLESELPTHTWEWCKTKNRYFMWVAECAN